MRPGRHGLSRLGIAMSWSLSEAASLAVKATRGAGYPWGLAQEAGYAIRWLQANGAPGVAALANHLQGMENSRYELAYHSKDAELKKSRINCPIKMGAAIMDRAIPVGNELGQVYQPVLLIPFISHARSNIGARIIFNGQSIWKVGSGISDHFSMKICCQILLKFL